MKLNFVNKNESSAFVETNSAQELPYLLSFVLVLIKGESKSSYSESRFKKFLGEQGGDINISRDDNILNISIKAENPGNVLSFAQKFGELLEVSIKYLKADELLSKIKEKDEVTIETIEEEVSFNKDYALIATSSGSGINEFFNEVGVEYIVNGGQTMNPSTEDFLKVIKESKAKTCYILPNNGNIIMAAEQTKEIMKEYGVNIVVIPSKTIMQGIVFPTKL